MKLLQRIICAALIASMAMTASGCVSETRENETEPQDMIETEPQENETDNTSSSETEESYLEVAEPLAKEIEALPKEPEEAIMTTCAIGGNPVFYIFDEGLTYYVQNLYYNTITEYTLELPEGYTDGKIVMATSGGGSGEIFLYVSADNGGVNEYLYYFFLCTHPVTFQYAELASEHDISRIEKSLGASE